MSAQIVKFQKQDQKEAYEFCKSTYEEMKWDKKYMWGLDDLGKTFGGSREVFFLAKENGKIIGCVGIKELNRKEALMKRFYVDKDYRGKGLAQQLFKEISDFVKKNNYQAVVLDTYHNNFRAQRFYEKLGFYVYNPVPDGKWPESSNPKLFQFKKLDLR